MFGFELSNDQAAFWWLDTPTRRKIGLEVSDADVLGNPYLICPGLPGEYTASRDAWRKTADVFNDIAMKLRFVNAWTGAGIHVFYIRFRCT